MMVTAVSSVLAANEIPNRLIDYREFEKIVFDVASDRESHRLTERQFLEAILDKDVVILDARSASNVKGAVNLPFTDFTAATLNQVIPAKTTKILIYCNNNFEGSDTAFPSKAPAASLNLSTYTSLRAYGYTNVFELGPLVNVHQSSIPFEGTEITKRGYSE
jgi:hypothetical protein